MATKRMFHVELIESDEFLNLPASAQNLYFHLGMRADDEGFITGVSLILLRAGASEEDLQKLIQAGFVMAFPGSHVLLLRHFYLNNDLRRNRWRPTIHAEERREVYLKDKVYRAVDALHPTDAQAVPPPAALASTESPASKPAASPRKAAPADDTCASPAPADMRLPLIMTMLQRTGISEGQLRTAMERYGFERLHEATRRICAGRLAPTFDALMDYLEKPADG